MLGAREPLADDLAGLAVRAGAPGEILARRAQAHMEGSHPAREVPVGEVVAAEHVARMRPGRLRQRRIEVERPQSIRFTSSIDGLEQPQAGCRAMGRESCRNPRK